MTKEHTSDSAATSGLSWFTPEFCRGAAAAFAAIAARQGTSPAVRRRCQQQIAMCRRAEAFASRTSTSDATTEELGL